jgi:hypothetical protein
MYTGWMTAMPTPRFEPTEQQRQNVEILVACGTPQMEIAKIIRHLDGRPISDRTLRKHFRHEIDAGEVKLKLRISALLIATIEGRDPPQGMRPIVSDQGRGNLLQLFLKARMGWREREVHEIENADGKPFVYRASSTDSRL